MTKGNMHECMFLQVVACLIFIVHTSTGQSAAEICQSEDFPKLDPSGQIPTTDAISRNSTNQQVTAVNKWHPETHWAQIVDPQDTKNNAIFVEFTGAQYARKFFYRLFRFSLQDAARKNN
uniref:Putative secreted protein n=1 Tax=Ixodes ricinus TaxID=34613 RepID=A0A147BJN4_IXORI